MRYFKATGIQYVPQIQRKVLWKTQRSSQNAFYCKFFNVYKTIFISWIKNKSTHATSEDTCTVPDSKALGGDVLTPLTLFSLKLLL